MACRLEDVYQERIARLGGGFSVQGSKRNIGVEILMGGSIGRMWQMFEPLPEDATEQQVGEVEQRLRAGIEAWIAEREPRSDSETR